MQKNPSSQELPLVSIIIPTYFRNDELEKALKSSVRQTHSNLEIIVVDDSGEAHARQICGKFDVTYIAKEENEGMMSAWNDGLEHANGDYIQILDDDDRLFSKKIEKQLDLLTKDVSTGVAHCGMRWDFGIDEFPKPEMSGNVLSEVLTLDTSPCVTSTLLIECDVISDIYPIPEYQGAADDDLKIELARRTKFDYVNEVLVLRGTGDDNVSTSMKPVEANKQILQDYSTIYEQVGKDAYRKALSKTLYREGYAHLTQNIWSLKAIRCFARSVYISPGSNFRTIVVFLLSFGGRPTVSFFELVGSRIKKCLYE